MKKIFLLCAVIILVATALVIYAISVSAQGEVPKIPHAKAGFEKCLDCHKAGGVKQVPTNHSGYTLETCIACHSYATTESAAPAQQSSGNCISCHSQPGLTMTLAGNEQLNVSVDPAVYSSSVHGKLKCTDCHATVKDYPHSATITDLRQYRIQQYEICQKCHFDNYTRTLDSAHYRVLSQGNASAPLCTDCHGTHDITTPDQPRSKISNTCATCHADVNQLYVASVHGKALVEDTNLDVPTCNDCHPAHTVADPGTPAFHLASVELCSQCHSNTELMTKYGISTNVVKSYLEDFHGATVALTGKESKDIWVREAVCTDCHGAHDIKSVEDPESSVIKANLAETCARCHPGAGVNFPSAWLSHYEPSVNKSPLVFAVQWFYRVMIPFVVVGLLFHIAFDIVWVANKKRRLAAIPSLPPGENK